VRELEPDWSKPLGASDKSARVPPPGWRTVFGHVVES
jgi:hypothetical protein